MSLRERVGTWLRGDEAPVILTAVVFALPAAYAVRELVPGAEFELGFFALMTVGVGVPRIYERWPVRYHRPVAVAWTLGVGFLVAGELSAIYVGVLTVSSPVVAAIVAFVVTDLGNVLLVSALFGGAGRAEDETAGAADAVDAEETD